MLSGEFRYRIEDPLPFNENLKNDLPNEGGKVEKVQTLPAQKKNLLPKVESLIRELNLNSPSKAEKLEKCETLARLASEEVKELIDDPHTKERVVWLKEAHKEGFPSIEKWRRAFANIIRSSFEEVGGVDKLKRWHELEGICEEIGEEGLESADKDLREAIKWVRHVHDRSPKRRLEIIEEINSEAGSQ